MSEEWWNVTKYIYSSILYFTWVFPMLLLSRVIANFTVQYKYFYLKKQYEVSGGRKFKSLFLLF